MIKALFQDSCAQGAFLSRLLFSMRFYQDSCDHGVFLNPGFCVQCVFLSRILISMRFYRDSCFLVFFVSSFWFSCRFLFQWTIFPGLFVQNIELRVRCVALCRLRLARWFVEGSVECSECSVVRIGPGLPTYLVR